MTRNIGDHPTPEMYATGLEIDCQCARCGSSCYFETCSECGGDGYEYGDCEVEMVGTCDCCRGYGGWQSCMSSDEWCNAHPLPSSEAIKRGKIEWFTIKDSA